MGQSLARMRSWETFLWLALAAGVVASSAVSQSPERENLTEPVLRVANPPAEASPAPAAAAASAPAPTATQTPTPAATSVPEAEAPKVASLTPTGPAHRELSESEQTLARAVEDAHASLRHIRENVHDYTCLLVKREKVGDEVRPTEYIETKIRNRKIVDGKVTVPFSVYMKFVKPAEYRGREVIFVEGKNSDYVRVREGGTRGRFLPSVWLPPTGRLAMDGNRYPITEVGIENLSLRLIERSTDDRSIDTCRVIYRSGAKIDGRPCRYLEVKRPVPKTGDALKHGMNVYVAQVFIDEEWNIPIRYGAYDWPAEKGDRPEVVEEYTYQNIQINVGLTDLDFDDKNPEYNF